MKVHTVSTEVVISDNPNEIEYRVSTSLDDATTSNKVQTRLDWGVTPTNGIVCKFISTTLATGGVYDHTITSRKILYDAVQDIEYAVSIGDELNGGDKGRALLHTMRLLRGDFNDTDTIL